MQRQPHRGSLALGTYGAGGHVWMQRFGVLSPERHHFGEGQDAEPHQGDSLAQEMPLLLVMASPPSASPAHLYDRNKNREGEVRIAPLVSANG